MGKAIVSLLSANSSSRHISPSTPTISSSTHTRSSTSTITSSSSSLSSCFSSTLRFEMKREQLELTASDQLLTKLNKRLKAEYPSFNLSIRDAFLITDASSLLQNPIVYSSENFQLFTGYTKEELIGHNLRFFTGKFTDPETLRRLEQSLREGQNSDLELLCYKKDRTPFLNHFVVLPLHKRSLHQQQRQQQQVRRQSSSSITQFAESLNPVTHYVFLQREVRTLRTSRRHSTRVEPTRWKSAEVAFFLEALGLGEYGEAMVTNGVTGDFFLSLEDDDLLALGVKDKNHREFILKEIETLVRS